MNIKNNSIAYLGCVVDNMADYVSYVSSITSERNLSLIFGRLWHVLVNLVPAQNTMTSTYLCFFYYRHSLMACKQ